MRLLNRTILVATVALGAALARAQGPDGSDVQPGGQEAAPMGPAPTLRMRALMARRMGRTSSEEDVVILVGMLNRPEVADEARMALEWIPGEGALNALRSAVKMCEGDARLGVINSLGARRAFTGPGDLLEVPIDLSPEISAAWVAATGRTGTAQAGWMLLGYEKKLFPESDEVIQHAALECAWRTEQAGERGKAEKLYKHLLKDRRPRSIRIGAFLGLMRTLPKGKINLEFGKALRSGDPVLLEAVLRYLPVAENRTVLLALSRAWLDKLPAGFQLRLLAHLTARDGLDTDGLKALLENSKSPAVRRAALLALLDRSPLENFAIGATATSPDDIEPDHAGLDAPAAIDGDPGTYWDETDGQALYRLVVELPEPRTVSALSIDGYRHQDFAPRSFDVLLDNKAVRRVENARYENNRLWVTLPPTSCERIELRIDGAYGASPAIRELGIFDLGPLNAELDQLEPEETGRADGHSPEEETVKIHVLRWAKEHNPALLSDNLMVWKVHLSDPAEKGYIHPVALFDGRPLTWLSPPDHVWHRSLWFSWKFINGVNYWEEVPDKGITELCSSRRNMSPEDFSATYALSLEYHPPGKDAVMREARRISISAPDERTGYQITWHTTFTALESEVVLDRTPPADEPDGKGWGGYAGMSVRLAKETRDWRILDSEGREGLDCHRQPARWIRADFARTDTGREAGIAILDHPKNRRHPTPSFIVLTPEIPFVYYSPAILFDGPLTLKAGESLSLAYRILVHPGRAPDDWIDEEWERFAQTSLLPAERI